MEATTIAARRADLLAKVAEILETPALAPDTPLEQTELWDSMAVVLVMAALDEIGVSPPPDAQAIGNCTTASELMTLAGLG